ncbi:MAG: isocitrate lyase/PEP mutase family protein [Elusimicrobiota bacterium]
MRNSPGARFKKLMKKGLVVCPGVFDPITARLAEDAGFQAGYISGAGLHGRNALSDTGLLTREEIVRECARIARAAAIPFLADADTGFGGAPALPRTVRLFESAGVAGIQIEDQRFPKRCGHLPGKELVSAEEMADKIRRAARARRDKDFLIIARTDARGVTGLADAVRRALIYRRAGADLIFPEALETRSEFRTFAAEVRAPLLANMTEFGRTPLLPARDFEKAGFAVVIFPMTVFRAMMGAARDALRVLKEEGGQKKILPRLQTRREFYKLIRYRP